jgi:hypothetical protein
MRASLMVSLDSSGRRISSAKSRATYVLPDAGGPVTRRYMCSCCRFAGLPATRGFPRWRPHGYRLSLPRPHLGSDPFVPNAIRHCQRMPTAAPHALNHAGRVSLITGSRSSKLAVLPSFRLGPSLPWPLLGLFRCQVRRAVRRVWEYWLGLDHRGHGLPELVLLSLGNIRTE